MMPVEWPLAASAADRQVDPARPRAGRDRLGVAMADFFLDEGRRYTRRQDMPPAYVREGTIYLARMSTIEDQRSLYGRRCKPMVLSPEESLSSQSPSAGAMS